MGRHKETFFEKAMETIDLFNETPYLTMHKKRVLSTTIGGILSLILVAFILYQATIQISGMMNHEGPQLVEVNELEQVPSASVLGPENNFLLAITVFTNGSSTNFSAAAPFNFKTTYSRHFTENSVTTKETHLVLWAPCNATDFPEEIFGKAYSTNSLQFAYCAYGIDYKNDDGSCPEEISSQYPDSDCITPPIFSLEGTYGTEVFDFIQSTVSICDPTDPTLPSAMVCAGYDIPNSFSSTTYELNLYTSNQIIDRLDYENPNSTFIDTVYWNLNPKIYKVSNVFVDKITIQDFDDYFSGSSHHNETLYSVKMASVREMSVQRQTAGTTLLQWNLRRSLKNQVLMRTYPKVQEFLTEIGGFSKALMFISAFIAIGYLRYRYQMALANELYDFELPDEDQKPPPPPAFTSANFSSFQNTPLFDLSQSKALEGDEILTPKSDATLMSLPYFPAPSNGPMSPTTPGVNDRAVLDFFAGEKRRKKLNVSEIQYFKSLIQTAICCKKNVHEQYAARGRDMAMADIDVFAIVRKLNEVERLKYLILTPQQKKGMELLERPVVKLRNQNLQSVLASKLVKMGGIVGNLNNIGGVGMVEAAEADAQSPKAEEENKAPADFDALPKFGKLFAAYKALKEDKTKDPAVQLYNRKLILMINPSLIKVFKRAEQILGENYDHHKFEEVIKKILRKPKSFSFHQLAMDCLK